MSPGATHNSHPGSDAPPIRGLGSARHFAPEGREHISLHDRIDQFESVPSLGNHGEGSASLHRNLTGQSLQKAAPPFLSSFHVYHVAHLSLYLRSFSQFVAEIINDTELLTWLRKDRLTAQIQFAPGQKQ